MNAENRYPVTASLFMLREIKNRQEKVNRGYQLLKRKAEALRIRGRQTASELSITQGTLGHTLREAYISLAAVKFTNGESNAMVLENIGELLNGSQAQVRVQRISENISGVSTVSLQAIEDPTASDTLRYAGLAAGGHRTGEAKKAFREAIKMLIRFASLRNTCILLDAAIKSTLRKVNGIEKVIMPKLRNTETYILTEMDEREREEFHRLKMVKAKKVRTKNISNRSRRCEMTTTEDVTSDDVDNDSEEFCAYAMRPYHRSIDLLNVMLVNPYHTPLSSTLTESSGDYKPACLPHNWDDDDLLF